MSNTKADDELLKTVIIEWFDELVGSINTRFQAVYAEQPQNARDAAANTVSKVFAYVCLQLRVPPDKMLDLIEMNAVMLAMFGPDAIHQIMHMHSKLEIPPAMAEEFAAAEAKALAAAEPAEVAASEKPARTLH